MLSDEHGIGVTYKIKESTMIARFGLSIAIVGYGLATICDAQANPQIATAKNAGAGGVAIIGGPPVSLDGKNGKPRFPIIPAGTAIKQPNIPQSNQRGMTPNKSGISNSPAISAAPTHAAGSNNNVSAASGATDKGVSSVDKLQSQSSPSAAAPAQPNQSPQALSNTPSGPVAQGKAIPVTKASAAEAATTQAHRRANSPSQRGRESQSSELDEGNAGVTSKVQKPMDR